MRTTLATFLALVCLSPLTAAVLDPGVPAKVMCVGDSITLGKDTVTGGYRSVLYAWLTATGHPITYVGKQDDGTPANATVTASKMPAPANGEGYGSFRIDMILDGGQAERRTAPPIATTLATYQPDIVLLMIGTNDVLQDYQMPAINQRMEHLVTTILAAGSKPKLLVASIAPITHHASRPDREPAVAAFNQAVQALVTRLHAEGRPISFVDVHASLEHGGLDQGGVHPTGKGYEQVAAAWFQALTGTPPPGAAPAK